MAFTNPSSKPSNALGQRLGWTLLLTHLYSAFYLEVFTSLRHSFDVLGLSERISSRLIILPAFSSEMYYFVTFTEGLLSNSTFSLEDTQTVWIVQTLAFTHTPYFGGSGAWKCPTGLQVLRVIQPGCRKSGLQSSPQGSDQFRSFEA